MIYIDFFLHLVVAGTSGGVLIAVVLGDEPIVVTPSLRYLARLGTVLSCAHAFRVPPLAQILRSVHPLQGSPALTARSLMQRTLILSYSFA